MKTSKLLILLLTLTSSVYAQNLILNGSYDKPLTGETRLKIVSGWADMKIFTEDTTWNKAVKMTVSQIYHAKNSNRKCFLSYIFIGGDGKKINSTFTIKPETTYRYSLRFKTDIKPGQAVILCRVGTFDQNANVKKQLVKTQPLKNLNEKTWTTVSGTFFSGKETEASILISIYADTQYGEKMQVKVGNWVMVDDVVIEPVPELPAAAKTEKKKSNFVRNVYESGKTYGKFRTLKTNCPPSAETFVCVVGGRNTFQIVADCKNPDVEKLKKRQSFSDKNNPWKDADLVEFFFLPESTQKPMQFAVSLNGAKWTSVPDCSSLWTAKIEVGKDHWKVTAEIPYQVLGYSKKPEDILFFTARERNHVQEYSSLVFQEKSFHAAERYGVLINIPFAQWASARKNELIEQNNKLRNKSFQSQIQKLQFTNPEKVYAQIQSLKKDIHWAHLEEQKVIVSLPFPGEDFHLPYIPQKFLSDRDSITIRAAGNELYPVPIVISNLSTKTEEYRITIEHLDKKSVNISDWSVQEEKF